MRHALHAARRLVGIARRKSPGERRGVLIVDDHDDIRRLVKANLKEAQIDPVFEAADGESALQIVFRERPDVIVLDLRMPNMDGSAVARQIRVLSPGAAIIVFSAFLPEAVTQVDADAFLDKTAIAELPVVVKEQLQRPEWLKRRRHG